MMRPAAFAAALLSAAPAFAEGNWIDYRPGMLTEKLRAGETLVLNYKAVWSGTSLDQVAAINEMKAQNADLVQNVTFIRVDWDTFGPSEMSTRRNIPRHGTLIVLKGKDELDRVIADTSEDALRDLLQTALQAAQS